MISKARLMTGLLVVCVFVHHLTNAMSGTDVSSAARIVYPTSSERKPTMTEQFEMAEHTIVVERDFDAPRERVWRAWTDPDELARWWGPEHFTTPREKIEFDLRPGGVCRMTMVGPDGEEHRSDGHFGIVQPPERLSFGQRSSDHPMIESGETTVEFIDLGASRTKVVVTSRMVCAQQLVDMSQKGWSSQLDKLVSLLEG
jgi:uncharacterized protein YndB with AHSA1/START domain